MFGIISYEDIEKWEDLHPVAVEGSINWCFILLGNPHNPTPALRLILDDNFDYLNRRTKEIRFFVPGCTVNDKGLRGDRRRRFEERFDFYEEGFLDTIDWLENGCKKYTYSENMEMILLPYYKNSRYFDNEEVLGKMLPTPSFTGYNDLKITYDFDNMLWYNLDQICKDGYNILSLITNGVEIARQRKTPKETKTQIEQIFVKSKKTHKVFIAGSKSLNKERDALRVVFSQITNRRNTTFQTWTYEDFPGKIVKGGQQNLYNSFIEEEAESVIFILENNVGGITKKEFDVALNSFRSKGHPQIYVFHHESEMLNKDIEEIKAILPDYYKDYQDLNELKLKIWQEFDSKELQ